MSKKFKRALFLFRRDLRLQDNTGLLFALNFAEEVIPAFIFTPEQIEKNPLKNEYALQFMVECLLDLQNQLKERGAQLFSFHGTPKLVVEQLIKQLNIDTVIVNKDYTPYSRERDGQILAVCQAAQIPFYAFDDALLHPVEEMVKKDQTPYIVFTPYFRNALKHQVRPPQINDGSHYFSGKIAAALEKFPMANQAKHGRIKGGRKQAIALIKKLADLRGYETLRDFPDADCTSHLSAYLKFTVCSPREIYAQIKKQLGLAHPLIRSLYWRDFFTSIAFFFPHVFEGSFHKKFDKITWSLDKQSFKRWCEGSTGFPIVDAGMRELNQTGLMHNRVRMIVASFLVKDLHIDWKWGEQYFAKLLIDYDPAVNNGNWQWAASTGCDAQPYFRIFNPWNQQKKFDPECIYIKKWVEELRENSVKEIHDWPTAASQPREERATSYLSPMVEHRAACQKTLLAYRSV